MPIFRIEKTKNYKVMSNYHLKDKRLSFKAKGLLSYMLSLPDTWDFSLNGLCSASKDNITSIRSTLKELQDLIANNKSGICTKKKLIFGASVIDCSYQGEWHFHLINTSDHSQEIEFGQKIIQFIPHIISTDDVVISDLPEDEFFSEKTKRGEGGFGSTGV